MVAEGYDCRVEATGLGFGDGASEEGLVSKVHTIEHPDGNGGVFVGWWGG